MTSATDGMETVSVASARIPTSVLLGRLLDDAPPDGVTVAWLMNSLGERSFGLLMLLMALIALLPGLSMVIAVLLAYPAVQMMLARNSPVLPRFLAARRLPTARLAALVGRTSRLLARMERLIHPRWPTPVKTTKRVVGFVVLFLGLTMLSPVPFSHIIPALAVMLLSFAFLEEDGVLLCVALGAAALSLAITAAGAWATWSATGLL